MSGWRDIEGRTNAERRRANAEHKNLLDRLRYRPASFVKPALGFAFILVLVLALLLAMR